MSSDKKVQEFHWLNWYVNRDGRDEVELKFNFLKEAHSLYVLVRALNLRKVLGKKPCPVQRKA